jgi:hypothetical protein
MVMDFLIEIFNYLTAIVAIASAIAVVTPTSKDNEFLAKYVRPFVDVLALNIGNAKNK